MSGRHPGAGQPSPLVPSQRDAHPLYRSGCQNAVCPPYTLDFPDWFGRNWDALSDCLRDLEWVAERTVLLHHAGVPELPPSELAINLAVLDEAVASWRADDPHQLVVSFPRADQARLAAARSRGAR